MGMCITKETGRDLPIGYQTPVFNHPYAAKTANFIRANRKGTFRSGFYH